MGVGGWWALTGLVDVVSSTVRVIDKTSVIIDPVYVSSVIIRFLEARLCFWSVGAVLVLVKDDNASLHIPQPSRPPPQPSTPYVVVHAAAVLLLVVVPAVVCAANGPNERE